MALFENMSDPDKRREDEKKKWNQAYQTTLEYLVLIVIAVFVAATAYRTLGLSVISVFSQINSGFQQH